MLQLSDFPEYIINNVNNEIDYFDTRYKIVGAFDDSFSYWYILYSGSNVMFINMFAMNTKIFTGNDRILKEFNIDDIIEAILDDEVYDEMNEINCINGIILLKNIFDKSYKLSYIHDKDKELKFNKKLKITYNRENNTFNYVDKLYSLNIAHTNYVVFISKIKHAYIDLYNKLLNNQLSEEQQKQLLKDLIYCKVYDGK